MSSSVPVAIPNLITILTAALPSSSYIWFGKDLSTFVAPITLQILSVEGDQVPAELGPTYKREETYSIMCDLVSFAGDQLYVNRLSEVMTSFALITVAIANNPTLNSAVRFAEVGDFVFTAHADNKGMSLGSLTFAIRCSQRISSLS